MFGQIEQPSINKPALLQEVQKTFYIVEYPKARVDTNFTVFVQNQGCHSKG